MKLFKDMNRQEQEAYLMLPIINELKQLGGQSTTRELKREVVVDDELISENILTTYSTSSKSGRKYLPFNYPFNFAISNLVMAGMLDRPRRGTVKLTEKARKFKGSGKELSDQVYQVSLPMWHKRSRKNKESSQNDTSKAEEVDIDDCYIVEEDIEQPYLEISNIKWRDWVVTSKDRYIFHIPPNSIKENYEVNIND